MDTPDKQVSSVNFQTNNLLRNFLVISVIFNLLLFAVVGWLFKTADDANNMILMLKAMDQTGEKVESMSPDGGIAATKGAELYEESEEVGNALKKYSNSGARFSFEYPSNLYAIESTISSYLDEGTNQKVTYGSVNICTVPQSEESQEIYCNPTLQIVFGYPYLDGLGGGCDPLGHQEVRINGKAVDSCLDEDTIGILYPKHPEGVSDLSISGTFGETLDKDTVLEILDSIKFY